MIINAPPCPSPMEEAIEERKKLKLWKTAPALDMWIAEIKRHCKEIDVLRSEASK